MKKLLLLVFALALCFASAQAEQPDIVGSWEMESLTMEGETMDISKTGMHVRFEFMPDGCLNLLTYADWEYEVSEGVLNLKHEPMSFDLYLSPFTDENGKYAEKYEYAIHGDMLALRSDFPGINPWELYRAQGEVDGLLGRWDYVTSLLQEDYERNCNDPDSVDLTKDTFYGSVILKGLDGYIEFFEGGAFRWTGVVEKAMNYRVDGGTLTLGEGEDEVTAALAMEDGRLVLTVRERYFDGEDWIENETRLCLVPVQAKAPAGSSDAVDEAQTSAPTEKSIVGKWRMRELTLNEDDSGQFESSDYALLFEFTPEGELLAHQRTIYQYRYDEETIWLGAKSLMQYMLMNNTEQAVSYTLSGDRLLLTGLSLTRLWDEDESYLFVRLLEGDGMVGQWGLVKLMEEGEVEHFLQAPDTFEYGPIDLGDLRYTVEITPDGEFSVIQTLKLMYYCLQGDTLVLCERQDIPTDIVIQYEIADGVLTLVLEDVDPETGEMNAVRAVLDRVQ